MFKITDTYLVATNVVISVRPNEVVAAAAAVVVAICPEARRLQLAAMNGCRLRRLRPRSRKEAVVTASRIEEEVMVTPSCSRDETVVAPSSSEEEAFVTPSCFKEETVVAPSCPKKEVVVTPSRSREEVVVYPPPGSKEETMITSSSTQKESIVTTSSFEEEAIAIPSRSEEEMEVTRSCSDEEAVVVPQCFEEETGVPPMQSESEKSIQIKQAAMDGCRPCSATTPSPLRSGKDAVVKQLSLEEKTPSDLSRPEVVADCRRSVGPKDRGDRCGNCGKLTTDFVKNFVRNSRESETKTRRDHLRSNAQTFAYGR